MVSMQTNEEGTANVDPLSFPEPEGTPEQEWAHPLVSLTTDVIVDARLRVLTRPLSGPLHMGVTACP